MSLSIIFQLYIDQSYIAGRNTLTYAKINSFVFLLPVYFSSECRGRVRMVVGITSTWQ
jgi:hypothetical protein